jgi:hypothetical protein
LRNNASVIKFGHERWPIHWVIRSHSHDTTIVR